LINKVESPVTLDYIKQPLELKMYTKTDIHLLVDYLKKINNKSVLISWSHQQIPFLVKELSGKDVLWPKKRYDVVFVLEINGDETSFKQLPQMLLPGDKPNI
jgi:hypothetical protein